MDAELIARASAYEAKRVSGHWQAARQRTEVCMAAKACGHVPWDFFRPRQVDHWCVGGVFVVGLLPLSTKALSSRFRVDTSSFTGKGGFQDPPQIEAYVAFFSFP